MTFPKRLVVECSSEVAEERSLSFQATADPSIGRWSLLATVRDSGKAKAEPEERITRRSQRYEGQEVEVVALRGLVG